MIYIFGPYRLDTHLRELRRAEQLIALQPRAFQVLMYLVQHRDRIVTRQELLEAFWAAASVDRTVVARSMMAARKAIANAGDIPSYIQTVRGHGYRFVADVIERDDTHIEADPVTPPPSFALKTADDHAAGSLLLTENKRVTALCCVLVNAAELADGLEPEAILSVQQTLFTLAEHEVQHDAGHVLHAVDNGLLALFGVLQAQEDHARQAVFVALGLQQRLHQPAANLGLPGENTLVVGLGLHTGLVAIEQRTDDEQLHPWVMGSTVALAMRLAQQASPGTILVSEDTARLVQDEIVCEALGPDHTLPVATYQVFGAKAQHVETTLTRERTLGRFVGREHELATLQTLLAQVEAGRGQVVAIVGEPGMGKSRLLLEFRQRVATKTCLFLTGHCQSYGQMTPYLPLLDLVRQLCGLAPTDDPTALTMKVHRVLQDIGVEADTWMLYLLHLFGIPVEAQALGGLSPEALKSRTFAALHTLLLYHSRRQPLIIEVEDLHWIDATSEAYLAALVERLAGTALLLLVTCRPGYELPWRGTSYQTQIALQPLTSADSRLVVQSLLHDIGLSESMQQQIVAKAEGNPFFLEELTQAVVEQEINAATLTVPDTIQAVLAARIDRMPRAVKHLLQAAAVIGRDVPIPLCRAFVKLPEAVLDEHLRFLQAGEFLYETRLHPEQVYSFKHALTQEVAYQSLSRHMRQRLHAEVVQLLAEQFPEQAESQPELLAHHYTEAGLPGQAVGYWQQAGQRALERSAHAEAINHFASALALFPILPATPGHVQQELDVQVALGGALVSTMGWGASEVEHAYARARELCRQLGETPQLVSILRGLCAFYQLRGKTETVQELTDQSLALAQRQQEPFGLMMAHAGMGVTLHWRGELLAAQAHLEQSVALYDPQRHRHLASLHATDSMVIALSHLSWLLWLRGYPDQALRRSDAAIARAHDLSHPHSLVFALGRAVVLSLLLRDGYRAQEQSQELLGLAQDQEFAFWVTLGTILRGKTEADHGQTEAGVVQIRQGLFAFQARGMQGTVTPLLALLVEVFGQTAQVDEGLAVLDEAYERVEKCDEHIWEAELMRLHGALLMARPGTRQQEAEAEARFRGALDIARRQQALSWELRTAMSLSRLWQHQGKRAEARALLVNVYNRFTEGFDRADLQAAETLIETLA